MTRIARDLGVSRDELVRALLTLPLVVVVVAGIWALCAMFVAVAG